MPKIIIRLRIVLYRSSQTINADTYALFITDIYQCTNTTNILAEWSMEQNNEKVSINDLNMTLVHASDNYSRILDNKWSNVSSSTLIITYVNKEHNMHYCRICYYVVRNMDRERCNARCFEIQYHECFCSLSYIWLFFNMRIILLSRNI